MAECPCPILDAGIAAGACGYSIGGSTLLLLSNRCLWTVVDGDDDSVVKDLEPDAGSGAPAFYAFATKLDTLGFNSPFSGNEAANQYSTQTLNFQAKGGLSAEIIAIYKKIILGDLLAIVQTREVEPTNNENRIFLLGRHGGLQASANTALNSGLTRDDTSGITGELVGYEVAPLYEIVPDTTVYTSLKPIAEFLAAMQGA